MNIRRTVSLSIQLSILFTTFSVSAQDCTQSLPDSIDIIILQEADHLWDIYGDKIWKSYNPDKLPILLFQSSTRQWLVNHPNPPAGFKTTTFFDIDISTANNETNPLWHYFSATIWPFNNQWTTILPSLSAWEAFCNQKNIPTSLFPPDQLVFISLHERFHAFQIKWLKKEYKRIMEIESFYSPPLNKSNTHIDIPKDSKLASLCIQEQNNLYQAYIEQNDKKSKNAIFRFLELRIQRMELMAETDVSIENYMELVEGTAKYIEFRLAELFEANYQAINKIVIYPEFQNYQDILKNPRTHIEKTKNGEISSERFYATGTIICLLLDRFAENEWKINLFENYRDYNTNLINILSSCIE
jgi:hypothetical protein